MSAPEAYLRSLFLSHENAIKSFITGFCKDLSAEELKVELSVHHGKIKAFIDNIHEPKPSAATRSTPSSSVTPKRKVPTHTSSGKALKIAGAGTLFKTGTGMKRPPPSDDDDSDRSVDSAILEEASPRPPARHKRRARSSTGEPTDDDTVLPDAPETEPSCSNTSVPYQGTARRGGNARKAVFSHPFIAR